MAIQSCARPPLDCFASLTMTRLEVAADLPDHDQGPTRAKLDRYGGVIAPNSGKAHSRGSMMLHRPAR